MNINQNTPTWTRYPGQIAHRYAYKENLNSKLRYFPKRNEQMKIHVTGDMPAAGKNSKELTQHQPVILADGTLKDLTVNSVRVDNFLGKSNNSNNSNEVDPTFTYNMRKKFIPHRKQFNDIGHNRSLLDNDFGVKDGADRFDNFVKKSLDQDYEYYRVRERRKWQPGRLGPVPGLTKYDLREKSKNAAEADEVQVQPGGTRKEQTAEEKLKVRHLDEHHEIHKIDDNIKFEKYSAYPKSYMNKYGN